MDKSLRNLRPKKAMRVSVAALTGVAAAGAAFGAAPPAEAYTNGVQLAVYIPYSIHFVRICGDNQNGTYTCFRSLSNFLYGSGSVVVGPRGWWWKGEISLRWGPGRGSWNECYINTTGPGSLKEVYTAYGDPNCLTVP